MFKAIVLACAVYTPHQCYEFHDNLNSYETYEKCAEKAVVMRWDILEKSKGNMMPQSFKCIPVKGRPL